MRTFEIRIQAHPGDFGEENLAGHLVEGADGRVGFRFTDAYRTRTRRPVLGQHFEDDLGRTYVGAPGKLPPWFANLIPEGPVRGMLERSLGLPPGDDLALLGAVGADLPGAVVVRPLDADAPFEIPTEPSTSPRTAQPDGEAAEAPLRFSVAGVQMKFSVLRDGERIVLPAEDQLGQWLVKLDSAQYPGLSENEYATMEWARAAGFDVPACALRPLDALPASLRALSPAGRPVFLIRRYDRDGAVRIHQEDLAQVAGLPPECKYGRRTDGADCRAVPYETLVTLLHAIGRTDAYREALRRLVLMLATGNSDAHLKNWSLLYPSPTRAVLAPLYDQVAVVAWEGEAMRWALPWGSTRGQSGRVRMNAFTAMAERLGESVSEAEGIVHATLDDLVRAWSEHDIAALYPPGHADAVRAHWRDDGPLLRPRAASLG